MLEPHSLFVKVSVLAALAAVAAAQSLTGRGVEVNGAGISGVTVSPSNGGPSGLTNATGNFTITGLQNRTYAFVDFRPATNTIAAAEVVNVRVNNATTLATVTLQPGALVTGVFVG